MHTQKYTKEFKEQALVKVYSRQTSTIESIAEELNLPKNTLKMWIKKAAENMPLDNSTRPLAQSQRTEDWTIEERLVALQQSYQLTGEVLHNWCRERGIYAHHYMVMDVFSRKIVGWQVYEKECTEYASDLMIDICHREQISAGQVVLHSDNGA